MSHESAIGAGLLIVRRRDGKVLLLKRAKGGPKAGYWNPPGGTVEDGETPFQGALREAREELGSLPRLEEFLRDEGYWHAQGPYFAFGTFLGVIPIGAEDWEPRLNEESSEWGWFSPEDLPKPLIPGAGAAIRDLSDRTWRWKPPSHRMGISAPSGTLSLFKVVNLDPTSPFYLSTAITIRDERTMKSVMVTVPFENGEPVTILMPVCRDRLSRDSILDHYQELLKQDPALVLIAVDEVEAKDVPDVAFSEAAARSDEESIEDMKRELSVLVEDCVN